MVGVTVIELYNSPVNQLQDDLMLFFRVIRVVISYGC